MERSKNIQHHALASILFLLGAGASHADQQDIFFDNPIVPIVLSASKLPQSQIEAPASVTVIDRALIKASGATQVAELFRLVPGMQVGNARGNFPVVAYQGLTSEFPQGTFQRIDLSLGKLFTLTDRQSLDITLDTQLPLNKISTFISKQLLTSCFI